MNAYAHKLLARAEGIWKNLGLFIVGQDVFEKDGCTSIVLRFNKITPAQAEMLISQMGKAFRRANIYWKNEDCIKVFVSIPPM